MSEIHQSFIPGVAYQLVNGNSVIDSYSSIEQISDKYCHVVSIMLEKTGEPYTFEQCKRICGSNPCMKVSSILNSQ